MIGHRKYPLLSLSLFLFAAMLLAGCGSGGITVKGKATADGAAAKGGSLLFAPVASGDNANPGKAAGAEIQPDGSFKIENARPGKNRVTFTAPEQKLTEEQRRDPKYVVPPQLYKGYQPKDAEVDLKSDGEVTIELVKKS